MKSPLRVYADTSVFGGCFEDKFREASIQFFEKVRGAVFLAVISNVTIEELVPAPYDVSQLLANLPPANVTQVSASPESLRLQAAYLDAGILGPASVNDAAHIAIATVAVADVIVSWNFKHIVRYDKIMRFESINAKLGYACPRIYSPYEVLAL